MREVVRARGHENVAAEHRNTLEVTTDDWLTPAGDCIVGVAADRAPADFDPEFVAACRDPDATIAADIVVSAGRREFAARVVGSGHPDLTFDSDRSHVLRTSMHVDDRTVLVAADGAAADLDRDIVTALARAGENASLTLTLTVE